MRRLKVKEVAPYRAEKLKEQSGKCALCCLPISAGQDVLDHDHGTGVIRAVLHRSCNALLGKVENNYKRYGIKDMGQLMRMLSNVASYLSTYAPHLIADLPLHPTHKTEDEKRLLRNKRARQARAKAKDKL